MGFLGNQWKRSRSKSLTEGLRLDVQVNFCVEWRNLNRGARKDLSVGKHNA